MRTESGEDFSRYLTMISNPMRKKILKVLNDFPSLPYLKLMSECHLSHPSHCGVFTYHLRKLIDACAITKNKDEYSLTSLGESWAKMIEKMEGQYVRNGNEELEFDMDKWCPFCLEDRNRESFVKDILRENRLDESTVTETLEVFKDDVASLERIWDKILDSGQDLNSELNLIAMKVEMRIPLLGNCELCR